MGRRPKNPLTPPPTLDPDRPPCVRRYIRVSHVDSVATMLSPDAQERLTKDRWDRELRTAEIMGQDPATLPTWATDGFESSKTVHVKKGEAKGIERTDGAYVDLAISARKTPFDLRPAGGKLVQRLRPGDVLIIAKLDRAFRSLKDAVTRLEVWANMGVRVIFCDPDADTGKASGRLLINIMAAVAEFDSDLKSERNKEIAQSQRLKGLPCGRLAPIGWKKEGKRLVTDNETRRDAFLIVSLKKNGGLGYLRISDYLEKRDAERENRPMRPNSAKEAIWDTSKPQRRWNPYQVRNAYMAVINGKCPPPDDEPLPEWYKQLKLNQKLRPQQVNGGDIPAGVGHKAAGAGVGELGVNANLPVPLGEVGRV